MSDAAAPDHAEPDHAAMDHAACYAAFKAHDPRFDGRLFVAVSSTGIYCRPVCRVKMPKAENCTFHVSAASAEQAGFRPCLKCRPELAPGNAPVDAAADLARGAAMAMEEDNLSETGLAELARRMGITDRHLRRTFAAEYGVSPVQYLQTRRLLLAKSLLADTRLPVTEIAFAAGFGSIRRFNDLFRKHYRLSPGDVRRQAAFKEKDEKEGITVKLGYRPPLAWNRLLAFLASRAVPGVESVADGGYRRTVALPNGDTLCRGWIAVTGPARANTVAVTLSPALLPVLSKVLARVRHLFDLNCHPAEVAERLASMDIVVAGAHGPGIFEPGTRLPGCFDPFEMAVRAVLGQQITVKAARTLAMRLTAAFGRALETPFPELTHTFPSAETIAGLEQPIGDRLGPLGITGARARSIFALANALASGDIVLSQRADPRETMQKLLALPGFGPWTVEYVAMRALAWPDAFPHTDLGVKKALAGLSPDAILNAAEQWRPWRSYATIALWDSLAAPPLSERSTS